MRILILWLTLASSALAQTDPPATVRNMTVNGNGSVAGGLVVHGLIGGNNVKYFGALMNGTTNDSTAFQAARTAAPSNSTIYVPDGGYNAASPTGGPTAGNVLWLMSGNDYGLGSTPVINIGEDVVESYLGGKYFGRASITGRQNATVRVDGNFDNTVSTIGAVSGNVANSLWVLSTVPPPATSTSYGGNYVWGFLSTINDDHIGPAENIAGAFAANRLPFSDGFGPRGPIWAGYFQPSDQTGLSSDLSGALIGVELDMSANDDDPDAGGNGGSRIGLSMGAGMSVGTRVPARLGTGISIYNPYPGNSLSSLNAWWGIPLKINSTWDTAGIDLSHGGPLVATITTTVAQGAPGITIPMPYTSGVTVGAVVSGTDIPSGDTVVSKTKTSVTLATTTSTAVPLGTTLIFSTFAPAIQLGSDQKLCFKTGGDACFKWNVGGSVWQFAYGGVGIWTLDSSGNETIAGTLGVAGNLSALVLATGTSTARSLSNWFADTINVKSFGALMNGTTDDSAAFQAARSAAPHNGIIYVPPGGFDVPATPTGSGVVLWNLSGNGYGTGTTPVTSVGTDTVETFFSGTKFIGRQSTPADPAPLFRLDHNLTTAGGKQGNTASALQINSTAAAGTVDSLWPLQVNLTSHAANNGANWPQNVGAQVSVTKTASAPLWAAQLNLVDSQNLPSSTGGGMFGLEIGMNINAADDARAPGGGSRRFLDLIASTQGRGAAGIVGNGVLVRTIGTATIASAFHAYGDVTNGFVADGSSNGVVVKGTGVVGLTTAGAKLAGPAIRIAAGQVISLDAADDRTLYYDAGTGKLFYAVGGVNKFSIDANGNVKAAGTITANTTP